MKAKPHFPIAFWRLMSGLNRRITVNFTQMSKIAGRVLVLTTLGRKSGLPRRTPLQYEEFDGVYYVASARGADADWYRNLLVCPEVEVQVGEKIFHTSAVALTDRGRIADFLELRLERHPHFMSVMLRMEGLPRKFTRADLENLAERLAIVRLTPAR